MVDAAVDVARRLKVAAIFIYVDSLCDIETVAERIAPHTRLVLVARDDKDLLRCKEQPVEVLAVPNLELTRMAQIKMGTLMAFSQRLLATGDRFLFLVGVAGRPLDTLVNTTIESESEIFQSIDQPRLTEHIKRVVFQQVLTLALEVAHQGREGRPVGGLFVIGDHREVQRVCQQNIINPFKGYPERERNVLSDAMRETIKEFMSIDGAFVIKGNGVVISAGTTLRPNLSGEEIPPGLGTRHATAAAITASTKSIAITVSESTGTVRIWRRGRLFTEIERGSRNAVNPRRNTELGN